MRLPLFVIFIALLGAGQVIAQEAVSPPPALLVPLDISPEKEVVSAKDVTPPKPVEKVAEKPPESPAAADPAETPTDPASVADAPLEAPVAPPDAQPEANIDPPPAPIVPPDINPGFEVVDEREVKIPVEELLPEPEAKEEKSIAAEDETGVFVDPELGMLPPAAPPEDSTKAVVLESSFKPSFDYGGEWRARLGNDLAYEYSLVQENSNEAPVQKGTEDVIDFRTSFQFWTRLSLTENIQAFLEFYAEYSVVGKRNEDQPTVIFNGSHYRHDYRLEPWEMYFDFFFGSFDLRVGNQIVSWGTLNVMSPSDRFNQRDPGAYYWSDVTGAKQPVLTLKGIYHVSDLAFEFVISPFFIPPPIDLYGGDYSLFRYGSAYGMMTYPIVDINRYLSETKTIGEFPDLLSTRSPGGNPLNSQLGFRFSGSKGGFDFGISYLFGYEELPTATMDPELRALGEALMKGDTNLTTGYAQSLLDRIDEGESIDNLISSEYRRKHSVAAEFGTTVWELGIKAEMAFLPDKTYYTQGLTPETHHTLAYAIGVDVLKTDLGELSTLYIDMELFGSALFGVRTGEMLVFITERNLGLFTTLRFSFLDNDLELEAVNQINFSTRDYVLIPKISYSPVTNLRLTLGVMLLQAWAKEPRGYDVYSSNNDRKDTMFGQFSNNDQVFLTVRYSF